MNTLWMKTRSALRMRSVLAGAAITLVAIYLGSLRRKPAVA